MNGADKKMNQPEKQQDYNDYDEIDLRDIFKTLGKWKYKITAVTLTCMLLSGIASFFFLDPVYEGKAVVATASISPLTGSGNYTYIIKEDDFDSGSKKVSDNVDELVRLAQIDAGKYQQLATSVPVLQNTIKELNLELKMGQLKAMVKVEPVKENNGVMEVKVEAENPELAASIANTLVQQTVLYLGEINNRKIEGLKKTLETQLESAQRDLDTSFSSLKEYQLQHMPAGNHEAQKSLLLDSEIEKRKLENKVKRNEDVVNSLSSKLLQLEMFRSLNAAENQVIVLSPAVIPEEPLKPHKTLNMAIAAVLGLMLSVFGAFLYEYLKPEQEH